MKGSYETNGKCLKPQNCGKLCSFCDEDLNCKECIENAEIYSEKNCLCLEGYTENEETCVLEISPSLSFVFDSVK